MTESLHPEGSLRPGAPEEDLVRYPVLHPSAAEPDRRWRTEGGRTHNEIMGTRRRASMRWPTGQARGPAATQVPLWSDRDLDPEGGPVDRLRGESAASWHAEPRPPTACHGAAPLLFGDLPSSRGNARLSFLPLKRPAPFFSAGAPAWRRGRAQFWRLARSDPARAGSSRIAGRRQTRPSVDETLFPKGGDDALGASRGLLPVGGGPASRCSPPERLRLPEARGLAARFREAVQNPVPTRRERPCAGAPAPPAPGERSAGLRAPAERRCPDPNFAGL